jgi:hypothetical protein
MNRCSDASYALRERPRVPRVSAFEDNFYPPEHGARTPGVNDLTVFYLRFNPEMSFNSGNRIND